MTGRYKNPFKATASNVLRHNCFACAVIFHSQKFEMQICFIELAATLADKKEIKNKLYKKLKHTCTCTCMNFFSLSPKFKCSYKKSTALFIRDKRSTIYKFASSVQFNIYYIIKTIIHNFCWVDEMYSTKDFFCKCLKCWHTTFLLIKSFSFSSIY